MLPGLALLGGPPVIADPHGHFSWPPAVPGLGGRLCDYIDGGGPLSIADRSGVYAELEDALAEVHERRFAIAMSSGTMGLYSAFFGLGIQPGDRVVSTVYSYHATASPLLHLGANVVFCDVESDTGNIDVDALAELVDSDTKAVVTNHMWGHPVDVDAVRSICDAHDASWVEDCSHAHFARYRESYVGRRGDVAVFSLQGNKLLTGGEGGVLLTDRADVYERATLLGHNLRRSRNEVKDPGYADILRTGYGLKFRMHPLAALVALEMLPHCPGWIEERRRTLDRFSAGLAQTNIVQPMARRGYVTSMGAHYGFKPRIDFSDLGISRATLIEALRAEGVDVGVPGSRPFHELALFDATRFEIDGFAKQNNPGPFPGADTYYSSIVSLPTFTFEDSWPLVDQYVEAFHKVLAHVDVLKRLP